MGWNDQIDEQVEQATADSAKERQLVDRARKVGLDVSEYLEGTWAGGAVLDVDRLERDVRASERKKERDKPKRQAPKNLTPEEAEAFDAAETDAGKDQVVAAAMQRQEPDPFDDLTYDANAGEQVDDYQLSFTQDVSPQMYRRTLLREDRGSQAVSGRPTWDPDKGGPVAERGKKPITAEKYVARVMEMSPDELEEFQRDLYAAGFFGSVVGESDREPIWGAPDEPTVMAVKALAYTTLRFKGKLSIAEVLDRFRSQNDADGDGKPDSEAKDKPKPIVRLTSQTDLKAAAQDRAVDLMGRRLADGQVGGAIGGYNQLESSFQTASQQAEIDNEGGTFTAPPSLSAYTEEKIRESFAPEVDSYTYLGIVNALLQRLDLAG